MKNILILIVAVAVFLHFYPQPEVTKFYQGTKEALVNGFSEFSDTSVRLKSDKIFTDLKPKLKSFSPEEVESLKNITSTRNNVADFYQQYCKNSKRSVLFHHTNQTHICNTISKYASML